MSQVGVPGYPQGNGLYPISSRSEAVKPVGHSNLLEPVLRNRRLVHVKPVGKCSLSATAGLTRHGVYVLPGVKWSAYKARVENCHSAAVDYQIAVLTKAALGDGVYGADTWDRPTFSGSLTGTVPGATGTYPQHINGYIDSDVMYSPSADYNGGTILALRSYCATANNTRFDPPGAVAGTSLANQGFVSAYKTAGDFVTTPSGWMTIGGTMAGTDGTGVDALPPISIIGYTESQMVRIGLFGSSTISGQADGSQLGWAWRTQNILTTDSKCYQFTNESMPGAKTSVNLSRFLNRVASGVVYDKAVYSAFTTNDSTDSDWGTAAYLNRVRGQMLLFIDTCFANGIEPILATFQSVTGMTGTTYTNCKAANAIARSLAAAGLCGLFDLAGRWSDETQSVGTWKNPSLTGDGTHPNTAGSIDATNYAVTIF